MKILLTGATGFLGKHVLNRLLDDQRVREIIVTTRRKRQHESPKVRVAVMDLARASSFPQEIFLSDLDCVIHLAGLYDFSAAYDQCYEQNVLTTTKLLWLLKDAGVSVPIHVASTYAVGCPSQEVLEEAPLEKLPPTSFPYAYSKALAEKIFAESGFPVRIFRFGILMGDSVRGEIEKLDGIYSFMKLMERVSRLAHGSAVRKFLLKSTPLPIPAHPGTLLPLVAVNTAAEVLTESVFKGTPLAGSPEYYGVYDSQIATVSEVVEAIRDSILPGTQLAYVPNGIPGLLLKFQERVTGVSPATFAYANHRTRLESKRFASMFPKIEIAPFSRLRDCWFRGFERYADFRKE